MLEDLTGLTQLHAETHARGLHQEADVSTDTGADEGQHVERFKNEDDLSIPDIDDDWTSL